MGVELADADWKPEDVDSLRGFLLLAGVAFHEAEECAQEALCRWLERGEEIEAQSRAAWLRTTARRIAIDRHRSRERAAARAPLLASPQTGDSADKVLAQIETVRLLNQLSSSQREVVAFYYLADMSIGEVAKELHMTSPAVRVALHRARRRLRVIGEGDRNA